LRSDQSSTRPLDDAKRMVQADITALTLERDARVGEVASLRDMRRSLLQDTRRASAEADALRAEIAVSMSSPSRSSLLQQRSPGPAAAAPTGPVSFRAGASPIDGFGSAETARRYVSSLLHSLDILPADLAKLRLAVTTLETEVSSSRKACGELEDRRLAAEAELRKVESERRTMERRAEDAEARTSDARHAVHEAERAHEESLAEFRAAEARRAVLEQEAARFDTVRAEVDADAHALSGTWDSQGGDTLGRHDTDRGETSILGSTAALGWHSGNSGNGDDIRSSRHYPGSTPTSAGLGRRIGLAEVLAIVAAHAESRDEIARLEESIARARTRAAGAPGPSTGTGTGTGTTTTTTTTTIAVEQLALERRAAEESADQLRRTWESDHDAIDTAFADLRVDRAGSPLRHGTQARRYDWISFFLFLFLTFSKSGEFECSHYYYYFKK
jgi:hypothetical protein